MPSVYQAGNVARNRKVVDRAGFASFFDFGVIRVLPTVIASFLARQIHSLGGL